MDNCDLYLHRLIGKETPTFFHPSTPEAWVRPSEWPNIDSLIDPTDDKIVAIYGVDKSTSTGINDRTPVGVNVTCTGGTYSVDWGDGTSDTGVVSGTSVFHYYQHTNTTLTDTSYGYKCAIITITATANITAVNLKAVPTGYNVLAGRGYKWLDIDARVPNATVFDVNYLHCLQQFRLRASTMTSYSSFFHSCFSLANIIEMNNSATVTNMSNMFNFCSSLTSIHLIDTSNVTNMSYMFSSCSSLTTIPLLDTSSVEDMFRMFHSCYVLESIPLLNTADVTDMSSMFQNCYSLTTIPLIDTSNVTNMSGIFLSCYSLTSIPLLNTSSVTNMRGIFNSCYSLTTIPLIDTSNAIDMSLMFQNCYTLETIPALDCSSMMLVPSSTGIESMFSLCYSLKSIPAFTNMKPPVTNMNSTTFIRNCHSLERCQFTTWNGSANITLIGCYMLGVDALNEIFTNLVDLTGFTTRNINVSACRGKLTCDPSIATAKNWTVTT